MADLPSIRFESNRVWAIPLFDSEHRKWEGEQTFNFLHYDWSDIEVSGSYTMNNILIAVTKRYNEYSNIEIQRIASGISTYRKLSENDEQVESIFLFVLFTTTHFCNVPAATTKYQPQKTKNEFLRDD